MRNARDFGFLGHEPVTAVLSIDLRLPFCRKSSMALPGIVGDSKEIYRIAPEASEGADENWLKL
jgi:hypothetical protein